MKSIFLLPVFLLGIITYSISQDHRYSFSDKYEVEVPARLKVYTTDGFITVKPSEGNYIEVFYIVEKGKNFLKISREEMDLNYLLEVREVGKLLDISLRRRNENKWEVARDRYNVSCEIFVPKQTSCDLTSADGNITLVDLIGSQKCITIDGHVKMNNIVGPVNASTSCGNVKVNNIKGDVDLQTTKGDIKMTVVTGNIIAGTSEGDIRFDECEGSIAGRTSIGDIKGDLEKLTGRLKLVTRSGDIDANIPAGVGMDMKLKGKEMTVPNLDKAAKITENQIYGTINGGGIPVELSTQNGNVKLSYDKSNKDIMN
ncbi:MAG: DUF4097 domain-containing protein [Bacteroidales bacterium]|nr:DUF4097 domain-containing protein [Bacteroidales bacterium]MCF8404223.1 DUF4097 domain-containing protein [Bacteroidales bacterium]